MPAAMMMPYQCISSGPRSSAIGLSGAALNIIAVTSIGHDLCIQPVVEFLCCIIPHILHAVVHRSHFDDTGKTPSRTDRNRLLVYFRIQYFDLFLIEAETFIRLVRLPRLQVYVQHDPLDRKSTRLNSSHVSISYAVFCLKKKNAAVRRKYA